MPQAGGQTKRLLKIMLDTALLLLSAQLPSEATLTLLSLSVGESALAKLIMRPTGGSRDLEHRAGEEGSVRMAQPC